MNKMIPKVMAAIAAGAMLLFVSGLAPRSQADPGATTYYQYFGASSLGSITSGTTITLSRLGTLSSYPLTLGTGGTSAFTATLLLSDSNFMAGDKLEVPVTYAAGSAQQTLAIYDSGTNGTLLHTSSCTGLPGSALLEFVNVTGTAWTYTPKGDLGTRSLAVGAQAALEAAVNSSAGFVTGSGLSTGSAAFAAISGSATTSGSAVLSGSAVSSGSSAVSGSATVSGSAAESGSSTVSGSAGYAGITYGLADATGTLSPQASIQLSPVLSSTSISGCVEDLDGDQPAGTGTNSVAPGSTVTTWVALTGSSAVANTGGAIFQPGLGMYFNGSTVFSIPPVITGSTWTVIVDYTPGLASNSPLQFTGNNQYGQVVFSSTNYVNAGINCGCTSANYYSWNGAFGGTAAQTGEGKTIMTSMDSTGLIYQDGFPNIFYQGTVVDIHGTTMYLGSEGTGAGYCFTGWIHRVRIYNVALTAAQYAAIWQSDAGKYKNPATNELTLDADSISSITPNNTLVKTGLSGYLNGPWDIRSCAWGGKTLENDSADDAAFAVMQDIRHPAPVVMEFLGTNSIYGTPLDSGSSAYALLVARCQARRAAGSRVAVATMLPRASLPFTYEAQRQTYNSLIRTNWRQFADAIIDFKDLAPTMDNWATNFNSGSPNTLTSTGSTQYQADLIHPTATGATILAQAEASVINGMTPASGVAPVSSTAGQILTSTTSVGLNAAAVWTVPKGNVAMSTDGSGTLTLKGYAALSGIIVSSEVANAVGNDYPFSTTLTGDTAGGANLTNMNAVTSGTWAGGGTAVFTGSNCLVGPSQLWTSGTSNSVSFVFSVSSVSTAQFLLGARNVGYAGSWGVYVGSGGVNGYIESASANVNTGTIACSANALHHAVMTYNSATNVLSLTVDGATAAATMSSGTYSPANEPFTIGAYYYGSSINSNSAYVTGSIGNVRIYPGVCLSATAAGALCQEGNGLVAQNLYLSGTAPAPVNTGTAAAWGLITTGTASYKLPLYQ